LNGTGSFNAGVLVQALLQAPVAARAAVAGTGPLADFLDRLQTERADRSNDGFLGDLQALADDPAGAALAIRGLARTIHTTSPWVGFVGGMQGRNAFSFPD
jgi:hypothetical protein